MNITIFGAGAFGTALGKVLSDNHHEITYYDVKYDTTLTQAIDSAEVLVFAVPTPNLPELLSKLPENSRQLPSIITNKGLFSLEPLAPLKHCYILSGPAFASNLKAAEKVTLTATNPLVSQILANDYLSIELSQDALGVLLCGTLKNIYAIGAGLFTNNIEDISSYLNEALQETKLYLENSGADPATADLSCGIGDLTLTATSSESRNLQCGKLLRQGETLDNIKTKLGTIEGISALEHADRGQYPLIRKIYAKVF